MGEKWTFWTWPRIVRDGVGRAFLPHVDAAAGWLTKWARKVVNVPDGVGNLLRWAPVVWDDRDWDQVSLYRVMRYKIAAMERAFRSPAAVAVGSRKRAKRMRTTTLLLDRMIDGGAYSVPHELHVREWGESTWEPGPRPGWVTLGDPPGVVTEADRRRERADLRLAVDLALYLENQDVEYLFGLLAKHVRGWWD